MRTFNAHFSLQHTFKVCFINLFIDYVLVSGLQFSLAWLSLVNMEKNNIQKQKISLSAHQQKHGKV